MPGCAEQNKCDVLSKENTLKTHFNALAWVGLVLCRLCFITRGREHRASIQEKNRQRNERFYSDICFALYFCCCSKKSHEQTAVSRDVTYDKVKTNDAPVPSGSDSTASVTFSVFIHLSHKHTLGAVPSYISTTAKFEQQKKLPALQSQHCTLMSRCAARWSAYAPQHGSKCPFFSSVSVSIASTLFRA